MEKVPITKDALIAIKMELGEKVLPYFTDEEIEYFLSKHSSVKDALYEMLIRKSEDTSLALSGLSVADTSSFFKRLASRYRSYNTGNLSV